MAIRAENTHFRELMLDRQSEISIDASSVLDGR